MPGAQDVTAPQPRPEPPRPAPEFNMETNDFPALPGAPAPTPAPAPVPAPASTEPSRFLDVVKGTAKMKLEDDQETIQDDLTNSEYEDGPRSIVDHASDNATIASSKPRSKSSSVSETPVVSVEKSCDGEEVSGTPLLNGELKSMTKSPGGGAGGGVPVVSINTNTDRGDGGSISPRQHSLDAGQKLTYAQMAAERERAAAAAAELGQMETGSGSKGGKLEDKMEKSSDVEVGSVKEATDSNKSELGGGGGHTGVDRGQPDTRSKHRPVSKTVSNQSTAATQGDKVPALVKGGGNMSGCAGGGGGPGGQQQQLTGCGVTTQQPSSVSATSLSAKPQGKRTDRPKSPPTAGGGSGGAPTLASNK